ncbi:uncharacterized protein GIQ15_01130 [Arthroderma uncinatum]|uniref:uncharacterized protein n=1 Tax=Arthroderma uncinatum TaxID=74035 RepID=UPI00144AD49F|nr:uncharacterized protein GIQ15_01130 [Arthroderma uncinatum]KAF3491613.1 hypothetical protein GIQ15_01130 [Arthroderma uncinatum]
MLLEKTSSTSVTALITPTKSAREKGWLRNRRQTDPLIREPVQLPQRRPSRHSIDAANANANANANASTRSNSSPLSSESFSNPALASFSPRKINIHTPSRPSPQQHQYHHQHSNSTSTIASPSPSQQQYQHHQQQIFYTPTPFRQGEQDQYYQTPSRFADEPPPSSTTTTTSSPSIRHITTSFINTNTSLTSPVSADSNSFHFTPAKEPKSPHYKRAPASRSSLGIETSSGPPPALSTQQRSLAQEKQWQLVSTADQPLTRRPTSDSTSASASASQNSDPKSSYSSTGTSTCMDMVARKEDTNTARERHLRSSVSMEERDRETANGGSSRESPRGSKVEDLFLNIAQTSSRQNTDSKGRRKSKFGLSGLSSRGRATEETPSPDRGHYSSFSQDTSPIGNYDMSSMRTPASAHPLDEAGRTRFFSSSASTIGRSRLGRLNHELSPEPQPQYVPERRDSVPEFTHTKPYKSSLAGARKTRPVTSYDVTDRNIGTDTAAKSKHEGTESTLSTTAPSTVWDELDDLKSRIRKLELTGKLPSSSAAAMSSMAGERPRTATTTVTTVSSSPKHKQKGSSLPIPPPIPQDNDPIATASQVHPLLHTALAKAKPVLNHDVYQALEATAADAVNLSTALSSNAPHTSSMSVVSAAATPDRILRRKADSVCRGLTELCLALSEDQLRPLPISKSRPGSRDASSNNRLAAGGCDSGTSTITFRRSASHEPEDLNFSRLQSSFNRDASSRRTSVITLSPSMNTLKAPQEVPDQSPHHLTTPSQRINRRSSLLRTRRQEQEDYDKLQPTTNSSSLRPISRSMTVTNNIHQGRDRYQRASRECTPEYNNANNNNNNLQQENSPSQQQQHQTTPFRTTTTSTTPVTQSAIPLRRTYMSTTSNIPTNTSVSIQPGFRRYASGQSTIRTVVDDYAGSRDAGAGGAEDVSPQPRSAGRTVSHFSGLQSRQRTNSMGTRAVGGSGLLTRRTFGSNAER